MIKKITQGSIISNMRFQKYHGIKCFGIIISARCDLAQGKIDRIHIIPAIPLLSWVQTAVFQKALSSAMKENFKVLEEWAQDEKQDIDALKELGPDKAVQNVQIGTASCKQTSALKSCALWKQYLRYRQDGASAEEIASFLNGAGKAVRVSMVKELFDGKLSSYCFVPEGAYLKNENTHDGFVADFKEIVPLSPEQVDAIQRGDYDYLRILETVECENLNQQFYLESPDDVVEIKYEIESPWIERLMQNFAFSFIRVGVDTITESDGKRISKRMLKECGQNLTWKEEN